MKRRKFKIIVILMIMLIAVSGARFSRVNAGAESEVTVLTAADVLSASGAKVSDAERAYLAENCDFSVGPFVFDASSVAVNDKITASNRTENGINWQVDKIYYDGKEADTVLGGKDDFVKVKYTADITVTKEQQSSFYNAAYDAALAATVKRVAFDAAMSRYEANLARYNDYIDKKRDYDEQYALYEADYAQYLAKYDDWKRRRSAYSEYLAEYEQYEREVEEFENYDKTVAEYYNKLAEYMKYLDDVKEYERELEEYHEATSSEEAQRTLFHFAILDFIDMPMTKLRRTLSGAILGDAVTQVLAQTEALVMAGAERAAIQRASDATINLRSLLSSFRALKGDDARYMFYISCADTLSYNFNELLRVLDYFYSYSTVRAAIANRDRTEQFEVLLAQLYYICNALDDGKIINYVGKYKANNAGAAYFDDSYTIGINKRTPASVIGEENVLVDLNLSAPLENGYVPLPAPPTAPQEVEDPGELPKARKKPVPPLEVSDPGDAPTAPSEPTAPDEVSAPTMPQDKMTDLEKALADAYSRGELTERGEPSAVTIKMTAYVYKYFRDEDIKVEFYEDKNSDPISTIDAKRGYNVSYPSDARLPQKYGDGYDYSFDKWVDGDGNPVRLNPLVTDETTLKLYPTFSKVPKLFDVVWKIGGMTISEKFPFGTTPVFDEAKYGTPTKEGVGLRKYRFAGWMKDGKQLDVLPPVEGNTEFEARFETNCVITFVMGQSAQSVVVWEGEIPTCPAAPASYADTYYMYEFKSWPTVKAATADKTYAAITSKKPLVTYNCVELSVRRDGEIYVVGGVLDAKAELKAATLFRYASLEYAGVRFEMGGHVLTLSAYATYKAYLAGADGISFDMMSLSSDRHRLKVKLKDTSGKVITPDLAVKVTISGNFEECGALASGTTQYDARISFGDGKITLELMPGYEYFLRPTYTITTIGGVEASVECAGAGETVMFRFDLQEGMYVRSVYAIAENGTHIEISDGILVMPASAVTIGAIFDYIECVIEFRADGKTLFRQTLKYGDEIVLPAAPFKAPDDEWSYEFVGWDNDATVAKSDMIFNAVFEKTPLVKEELPESALNKFIKAMYVIVPVISVGVIALIVVIVIKKRRRKKSDKTNENGD